MLCRGRIARRVPGRKPRADEHAAAPEAEDLLRSRHRGRDRAARPDPGRHGASLSETAKRHREGELSLAVARAWRPDELHRVLHKTLGVPLFQEQAMRIAIEAAKFTSEEANGLRRAMATFRNVGTIGKFEDKMIGNMIARGYDAGIRQKLFRADQGFRHLRFSGKPCRELRPARLYLVMAEALSPRRLLLRAAQFAADGFLRAGADRRRRPQERRRGARDRRVLQLCAEHAGGGEREILRGAARLPPDRRFSWVDEDEERLKRAKSSERHSGARLSAREPGIHFSAIRGSMDSGLYASRAPE